MADRPLRPATDRRLGRPLPYQQANPTQAHPIVRGSEESPAFPRRAYAVLAWVSPGCPPLLGRFLRVTHPSATRQRLTHPEGIVWPVTVRLACVRHAASVQSEPGSNSSIITVRNNFRADPKNAKTKANLKVCSSMCVCNIQHEHPHKSLNPIVKEQAPALWPGRPLIIPLGYTPSKK